MSLWSGLFALAPAVLALVVYWQTLGPTVTGEDSGELVTAAYTLGVPHPPGYPLWTLLAKAFTLLPIGTVAWRVNLLSAVLAALTVGVVYLIAFELTRRRVAAVVAALAFAFSREFWEQSVIAEVYSLNALLIAVCALALLKWQATRHHFWLIGAGFAFGLGLTNHHSLVVLLPVFLFFVLLVDWRVMKRWRALAASAIAAALPLLLYFYLPIRSAADPPVDWGNPETWSAFWDVVTRKQYAFMYTENPRSLGLFFEQCWTFVTLYLQEFSPWLACVPVVGAVVLWRRHRPAALLVLGIGLASWLAVIVFNNFAIEQEAVWVNNVFWIPTYMIAAICAGGAVDGLWRWAEGRAWRTAFAYGCAAVVVLSPLVWNYRFTDKSDYRYAHDFASNVLRTLEPNAIYLPSADHATFPVLYLQAVEGLRPDVTVGNKYGYPEPSLYAEMDPALRARFHKIPSDAEERIIERWIVEHYKDRPVYFSQKRPLDVPGTRLVNAGLLFRVVREGERASQRDYFSEYRWHERDPDLPVYDLTARMILAEVAFSEARAAFDRQDPKTALAKVEEALKVGGETKEGLNNAGSLCAENGQLDAAQRHYTAALNLDPEYGLTLRNLAKVRLQAQNHKAALPLFEKLLHKDPLDPETNWLAYECLKGQGRFDEALAQLERMATFPYEDAKLYRELGMHYLNDERRPREARQLFAKSLQLNPDQPDLTQTLAQLDQPTAPWAQGRVMGFPSAGPQGGNPALPQAPMSPRGPSPPGAGGLIAR